MNPSGRYLLAFLAAATTHVAVLLGVRTRPFFAPPEFAVEPTPPGVEVELVAAPPAAAPSMPAAPPEPAPDIADIPPVPEAPALPAPPPTPEAVPAPTVQPAAVPTPEPPLSAPRPRLAKPPRRSTASPRGDGSSATPGRDATSAPALPGATSTGYSAPGYRRNPQPPYPEEARRLGQQGVVHLRVEVDPRGRVGDVFVIRSSGYPLLDESAASTVRTRWLFKPARRGEAPVGAPVTVPIRFTLDR